MTELEIMLAAVAAVAVGFWIRAEAKLGIERAFTADLVDTVEAWALEELDPYLVDGEKRRVRAGLVEVSFTFHEPKRKTK